MADSRPSWRGPRRTIAGSGAGSGKGKSVRRERAGYYAGLLLISAATLLLELALLRVFSVQQFYHFAFMAISLALLGAGASGSMLSAWPEWRPSPAGLCLAFGLATVGAYLVINTLPFDSFRIAHERRQVLFLAAYFLAAALPFIAAGLLVGGELGRGHNSHRVYAANLIGAALGSAGSLPALAALGGDGAVLLAATLAAGGSLFFARHHSPRWGPASAGAVFLIAAGIVALAVRPTWWQQQLSPYKTLPVLAQAYDARHNLTAWSATSRVDVVESNTIHLMPGLSLNSPVGLPRQVGLMLDGDNLMPINGLDPDADEAAILADHLPLGLAFRLRPGARTLVTEAGTGTDVVLALAAGAEAVTAVEENRLVIATVREPYAGFSHHLYDRPRVTVAPMSGRVFVRRPDHDLFDLVVVSLADPHRPVTSGAYSLTENYVYTVEAFRDYLGVLDEEGLLVVTRWLQAPPSECLRTFATMVEALRRLGLDPAERLVAFRTLRTVTILASRRPFTAGEIDTVRGFLAARSFDPVYFQGLQPGEVNRFNRLAEPVYHRLFVQLMEDPAGTVADYRFDIRPPTDDRPFFFHYFRWGQTRQVLATMGLTWQPFGGSGYFVLVALLLLVTAASALLILGPLLWRHWRRRPGGQLVGPDRPDWWRTRVFLYYAGLGLAFLFVEIALAQRFILLLDEPVIALAAVLASVLLFSGLGSLTVRRWRLAWGLSLLVALVALYPWLLDWLVGTVLGMPGAGRVLITVMVMAPLGYLMGLPFAGGLQILERVDPALVAWAWAINGCFSVISAVLAVMLALAWGFSVVLWLGAAAYAVALVSLGRVRPPDLLT